MPSARTAECIGGYHRHTGPAHVRAGRALLLSVGRPICEVCGLHLYSDDAIAMVESQLSHLECAIVHLLSNHTGEQARQLADLLTGEHHSPR